MRTPAGQAIYRADIVIDAFRKRVKQLDAEIAARAREDAAAMTERNRLLALIRRRGGP
jgi:hypothetical protein